MNERERRQKDETRCVCLCETVVVDLSCQFWIFSVSPPTPVASIDNSGNFDQFLAIQNFGIFTFLTLSLSLSLTHTLSLLSFTSP